MNVLVPIAGWDQYFPAEEFTFPKPLIDIAGVPMIEHTLRCLGQIAGVNRFTFVVRDEDCRKFSLDSVLRLITKTDTGIVRIHAATQGAVCSCLMAIDELDPEGELLISNSDQVLRADVGAIIAGFRQRKLDAAVITFDSTHPRFSFVRVGDDGLLTETSEKRVISRLAIAGVYYFRRAADFIKGAMQVLTNASPAQGSSYYISQVLNELILDGKRLGHHRIDQTLYFPLYTPQKVTEYEELLSAERAQHPSAERPVLIIPMAGEGRRFAEARYQRPKPLIDVAGKPMIERVLDNLAYQAFRTVVVARATHLSSDSELARILGARDVNVVSCEQTTEGSACTVLLAREHIDLAAPLIVANCDQIVDFDLRLMVEDCRQRGLDGSILVFREPTRSPKWSYARVGVGGLVAEVKEKVAISDLATVGIYAFMKGQHFIDSCVDMIARNDRTNGEFYTCPAYNYMIRRGLKVGIYEIPASAMHGIGTPEDLEAYLRVSRREPRRATV